MFEMPVTGLLPEVSRLAEEAAHGYAGTIPRVFVHPRIVLRSLCGVFHRIRQLPGQDRNAGGRHSGGARQFCCIAQQGPAQVVRAVAGQQAQRFL
ncbi:hypothetical protein EMIT0P260_30477 [Pseudomonas sp. IT-P260]